MYSSIGENIKFRVLNATSNCELFDNAKNTFFDSIYQRFKLLGWKIRS